MVGESSSRNLDSMTHLVQAACVSLADVRRFKNENFNIKYVRRNNLPAASNGGSVKPTNFNYLNPIALMTNQTYVKDVIKEAALSTPPRVSNHTTIIDNTIMSPSANHLAQPIASSTVLMQQTMNQFKTPTSPPREQFQSAKKPKNLTYVLADKEKPIRMELEFNDNDVKLAQKSSDSTRIIDTKSEPQSPPSEQTDSEPVEMDLNDIKSLKSTLMNLQSMIMSFDSEDQNSADDGPAGTVECDVKPDPDGLSHLPLDEQVSIYRAKVQQLEIVNADLKRELNQVRCEQVNKTGVQSGLRIRLNEQDNTILEMKNEKIGLQLSNEQLEGEKVKLREQLSSATRQLTQFRNDIQQKEAVIERLSCEIDELRKEKEQMRLVKQQVKRVSDTLEIVQEKENVLTNMISYTDRKLDFIDSKVNGPATKKEMMVGLLTVPPISSLNEFHQLKDQLNKLKQSTQLTHNQLAQSQIGQIESSLAALVDRLTYSHPTPKSSSSSSGSSSLSSSSANSPILSGPTQSQQSTEQTAQTSPSSLSIRSSSSSSSISATSSQNNPSSIDQPDVNESNVKKIISRLLSQNQISGASQKSGKQTSIGALLTMSSSTSSSSSSTTTTTNNQNFTQCFYYLDKSANPNAVTIFKNIDEITLSDFKEYVNLKAGNYKYRFKSLDPEFGILKEEISSDKKLLPKCEGKIVAWIETC